MSKNSKRIRELQAEIDQLAAQDAAFAALPQEHQLAITLHSLLCRWNHTDGCSWEYEGTKGIDDWRGHAHSKYLEKAVKVKAFCDRVGIPTDEAINLIHLLED